MTTMNKATFSGEYSMNNIPIPSRKEYIRKLIRKTEKFIARLRWKYFWAIKNKSKDKRLDNHPQAKIEIEGKNTYGFRTSYAPPRFEELEPFENALWEMIRNIKYRKYSNKVLNQLQKDLRSIKNLKDVIMKSNKNRNYFKMDVNEHNKVMLDNITPLYRKCDPDEVNAVNREAKIISEELGLSDVMQIYTPTECYVTVKVHKDPAPGREEYRLINAAKTDIGRC